MRLTFATEAAGTERPNEDFIAATPRTVVLLDGVGVTGTESGCIHGTPWFVAQLAGTLTATLTAEASVDLTEALARAIATVRDRHADTCDVHHPGTPSSTVIMLRQRNEQLDYLVLSDSVLMLDTTTGLDVITDEREAPIAAMLRATVNATPNGTTEHQVAVDEFMTTIAAYRNVPHGFWIASNNPDAAAEATTGTVPLHKLYAAAVATDGATRLADTFHLTDWDGLYRLLAKSGPAELIRQVRDAERSDPAGERWKRGKTHDDATAAHCTFTHT